ncbi:MAG: 50S ribosomal protein L4 [Magnetococcales bacterium]|nr:50S ribosomal protein L4 [Magnetococcales bacterium]MBF0149934.1 50S ribosomal protein L4 [Magnetococcales bacterium]MBF0172897.1 50S ribosomal protein L4 [Magnetococcales bacterium]MBF0346708.1 50S ribosomal protein L4 [Magnetococcales bacterium]MBF0630410.1 50S ribosomal protein L4 [Magnetococcales bacterium]
MEFSLKDTQNNHLRTIELSEALFGRKVRKDLLARMVNYQLAKRRSGTASTKGRSEVRGGGRKPYRQKGTGNARQGTIRAPQFRTGGIVFGPQPRSYAHKMDKKERRLALMTALSAKHAAGEMVFVEKLALPEVKTKAMKAILTALDAGHTALIVVAQEDRNVELSARNLPGVKVLRLEGINTYDLLAHEKVIITEDAVKRLEERLT